MTAKGVNQEKSEDMPTKDYQAHSNHLVKKENPN